MEYPNKFGWLFVVHVTFRWQATEIRYEISLRLVARASASLFAPQKFDFAQDDIQNLCWVIFVRNDGTSRTSPPTN